MSFTAALKEVKLGGLTGNQEALTVVETYAKKGRQEAIDLLDYVVTKHTAGAGAAAARPGRQAAPAGDRIYKMVVPDEGKPATWFSGEVADGDKSTKFANKLYSLKSKILGFKDSITLH